MRSNRPVFLRGRDVCHLLSFVQQLLEPFCLLSSHQSSRLKYSDPRTCVPDLSVECSWVLPAFALFTAYTIPNFHPKEDFKLF